MKLSAKTTIRRSIFILFLLLSMTNISAQVRSSDSSSAKIDTNKFVMQKSAWGAVLRSAILPGLGQFYNESYWKVPIVWGILGYLGYQWNSTNNSYVQYRDLYNESLVNNKNGNSSYLNIREFYKDQRDLFAVFIGLAYLLNLVDAYVDSHLFDFNISKMNSVETMQLSLKIKF